MALFQRMILLYSNHVDSFTLPQTFMRLLRKWTGIVIQGIQTSTRQAWPLPLCLIRKRYNISYKLFKHYSKIKQGPKMDNHRLESGALLRPSWGSRHRGWQTLLRLVQDIPGEGVSPGFYFKFNLFLKKNPQKPVCMALRPAVHRIWICLPLEAHLRPNWWSWTSWEQQTSLCWAHLCVSLGLGALLWTCCKNARKTWGHAGSSQ